jgi:AmiR/NasT family two-component response regulator
MTEADAFGRLQSLAQEKGRKLVEIAQMILTAEEVLN